MLLKGNLLAECLQMSTSSPLVWRDMWHVFAFLLQCSITQLTFPSCRIFASTHLQGNITKSALTGPQCSTLLYLQTTSLASFRAACWLSEGIKHLHISSFFFLQFPFSTLPLLRCLAHWAPFLSCWVEVAVHSTTQYCFIASCFLQYFCSYMLLSAF